MPTARLYCATFSRRTHEGATKSPEKRRKKSRGLGGTGDGPPADVQDVPVRSVRARFSVHARGVPRDDARVARFFRRVRVVCERNARRNEKIGLAASARALAERQVESEISCDKSSRIVLRDERSPCKQSLDRYDLACREIYPVRENRISSGTRRVKFPRRDSSASPRGHGYRHPLRIPAGSIASDAAGQHAFPISVGRSSIFREATRAERIPRRSADERGEGEKNRPIGSVFFSRSPAR